MSRIFHPIYLLFFGMVLSAGCASISWRERSKIKAPDPVLRESQGWGLAWPLSHVVITSRYGNRGSDVHEGIDLKAAPGTPVQAAQAGWVVYAGHQIRGYGRLVVLRHPNQVSTVYAHNSKILVKEGQRVKQGEVIAYSGNSGRSSGPHLHFEVRRGQSALDPIQVISGRTPAMAQADALTSTKSARRRK